MICGNPSWPLIYLIIHSAQSTLADTGQGHFAEIYASRFLQANAERCPIQPSTADLKNGTGPFAETVLLLT